MFGCWYNELGSTLNITEVDYEAGVFKGCYNSAVGDAKKEYLAVGRFDKTAAGVIGWTVSWQNAYLTSHSLTAWSGQLQEDKNGEAVILTTWLLTQKTKPENDWDSTNVGEDIFRRCQPRKEVTETAELRCKRSHPANA